jgi:hypothetical protein
VTAEKREAREGSWSEFIIDLVLPLGFGVSSLNEGEDLELLTGSVGAAMMSQEEEAAE